MKILNLVSLKWCLLTILLITTFANAAEKPTIVFVEFGEGLQTQDGKGFYAESTAKLFPLAAIEPTVSVQPFRRALVEFQNKSHNCIWPLDVKLLADLTPSDLLLIESDMLFIGTQHVFTAFDAPVIHKLVELTDKSVAYSGGSNLVDELTATGAVLYTVPHQDNKAFMLQAKRVEAVIGWIPDLLITFHRLGVAVPNYDKDFVLTSAGAGFVCHDTPANRELIITLNRALSSFKASDSFREVTNKYGVTEFFFTD